MNYARYILILMFFTITNVYSAESDFKLLNLHVNNTTGTFITTHIVREDNRLRAMITKPGKTKFSFSSDSKTIFFTIAYRSHETIKTYQTSNISIPSQAKLQSIHTVVGNKDASEDLELSPIVLLYKPLS